VGGFVHFLPAIVLTWIVVEVAAAQVPRVPWLAQSGLFIVFLDFYWAAAARALGISSKGAFRLASDRAGIAVEPLLVLFALAVLTGACLLVVMFQDSLLLSGVVLAFAVVVDGYVLLRSWPMWGIAFFFEGKVVWSPSAGAGLWSGPGLGAAWVLTGERGVWNPHSRRFLLVLLPLTVTVVVLRALLDWQLLSDLLLYVAGLPLLALVVVFGTGRLLEERNIDTDYLL
jgi:hypothetical protein